MRMFDHSFRTAPHSIWVHDKNYKIVEMHTEVLNNGEGSVTASSTNFGMLTDDILTDGILEVVPVICIRNLGLNLQCTTVPTKY